MRMETFTSTALTLASGSDASRTILQLLITGYDLLNWFQPQLVELLTNLTPMTSVVSECNSELHDFHCAFSLCVNISDLWISPGLHAVHWRHHMLVCQLRGTARRVGILECSLQGNCTWPIHWYMNPESEELLNFGG